MFQSIPGPEPQWSICTEIGVENCQNFAKMTGGGGGGGV